MTRICWLLVDIVSRMLEPGERDAVRGDFAESGHTGGQALRDVLGLVVRRQAALWEDWRPWLALVGLVVPLCASLIFVSVWLSRTYALNFWIIRNYSEMDPAVLESTGLTLSRGIVVIVCSSLMLIAWSWIGGFVLGALSRRTIWVNGVLFSLVWLFFSRPFSNPPSGVLPFKLHSVVFLLPLVLGIRKGLRRGTLELGHAILLAAPMASLTAVAIWTWGLWRQSGWHTVMLAAMVLLNWPVGYVVASAGWRRWRGQT
jgi:hypothetical protein